jgi:hypothetical protein
MRRRLTRTRHFLLTAASTAVLCVVLGGVASAQTGTVPVVTVDPAITGTAREGETLTVTAMWTGDPAPTAAWLWLRCTASGGACVGVTGATSDRYVVGKADVGSTVRVQLTVTNTAGSDQHRSKPTAVVASASPTPTPRPTPTPTPTPTVTPTPGGPLGGQAPQAPASFPPRLLDPFPVVRIRGVLTANGARISLLSVRTPRKAAIGVRCYGSSCPVRRLARRSQSRRLIRVRQFERELRAGTRLAITVTRPGRIGKWTTIRIRRGAAPKRSDQCAYPGARLPLPCPPG